MLRKIWHGKIKGDVKPLDIKTKARALELLDRLDVSLPDYYFLKVLTDGGFMKVYNTEGKWNVETRTEFVEPPFSYFLDIVKYSNLRKAEPNNYLERLQDVEIYMMHGEGRWEDLGFLDFGLKPTKITVVLGKSKIGEVPMEVGLPVARILYGEHVSEKEIIEMGQNFDAFERSIDIIEAKRKDMVTIAPILRKENINRELWSYALAESKDTLEILKLVKHNIPKWTYECEVDKRLKEIAGYYFLRDYDEKEFEAELVNIKNLYIQDKLLLEALAKEEGEPKHLIKKYIYRRDGNNLEFVKRIDKDIKERYLSIRKELFEEYEKYKDYKPVGAAYLAVSELDKKLTEEIEDSKFLKEFRKTLNG